MLELQARPLRADRTRLLAGLVTLPGLAMAATHAPLALLTFGPIIGLVFALTYRDRYQLDRACVRLRAEPPLPLLEVCYRERVLAALDLRFAHRHSEPSAELLHEPEGAALLLGEDPPPEAAWLRPQQHDEEHQSHGGAGISDHGSGSAAGEPESSPAAGEPESSPVVSARRSAELDRGPAAPTELMLLRLFPADLARLRQALAAVPQRTPPREDQPEELLSALGAAGVYGPRAETALRRHLREAHTDGRPSALRLHLQELSLRQDPTGAAARRVLAP